MGFRSYVDTQLTDALKVSRIIANVTNSDSEDDADIPTNFAWGDPLRKKLKVFPGQEIRIEPSQNIDGGFPGPWVFNILDGFLSRIRESNPVWRLSGVEQPTDHPNS